MKKQLTIFQYFSFENTSTNSSLVRHGSEAAVGLVVVRHLGGGCRLACIMAGRERARRRLLLGLEEAVA
jgi:hypothetical protein